MAVKNDRNLVDQMKEQVNDIMIIERIFELQKYQRIIRRD